MSTPVTVAVPLYNGGRFVREMLESLKAQTLRDVRILCVDDASSDDSASIAEACGVEVFRNEQRLGLTANWNRAVELSTSPYFVIAHQDDVYEPEFLARTLALLEAHPRAFVAHAKARYIDEAGRAIDTPAARYKETFWPRGARYERGGAEELRALIGGNYIICPAVMFRRDAFHAIGPFSARYAFVTDWEYWMRGVAAGYTVTGIAEPLLRWRRHESTSTAAHALSMTRFEEERMLLEDAGRHVALTSSAQFKALRHTLLDEFLTRLASGDRDAARSIAEYTAAHSRETGRTARAMNLALRGGAPAGRLLRAAGRAAFAVASRMRR